MSIEQYRKKRNFTKTSEPKGEILKRRKRNPIFVVHEHHARHLHYDLRLEIDGVLKSWAVPKEPPQEEKIKRLAVQVEDHPLEYADFEGEIPPGQYGAGIVKIWDRGAFKPIKISPSQIIIDLEGEKLKGEYVLVKAHFKGAKNSWLLFKK